jgi:FKBP-type peptidyl-prolyl cis-trans isomerase FklB
MHIQRFLDAQKTQTYEAVKLAGEAFLADNAQRPEVKTTASGLQYEVLQEGDGPKPGPTSQVTVHYHGTLIDGTVFDSSVQRGAPATFGVNQVIRGWTEALQLMSEGAKYRLSIPQELAYGANPHPGGAIQPYAALIFDVELLSIA